MDNSPPSHTTTPAHSPHDPVRYDAGHVSIPPPPVTIDTRSSQTNLTPQAVVRVLSPRGIEYVFMTISLLAGASGLIAALIALVNGKAQFSILAFPAALLIVSVPIFSLLFLRLKKAEFRNPALKLDPSKRRSTQFIQILGFVTCFFTIVGLVSALFAAAGGDYNSTLVKLFLDAASIIVVAGGILFYYWHDEHRGA